MLPDFKLILRPNNQVSLTLQNTIKKQKTSESLAAPKVLTKKAINAYVRRTAEQNNLQTLYSHRLKHEYITPPVIAPIPPLDLINRFQHRRAEIRGEKLGYGKTPKIKYFSTRAGQKIRETGAIIDRLCGDKVERCRVVTLTIPSSEKLAYKAISDYSGYAANRLFQIIRRDYQLAHWFYVYEHQKRGALHLHICVYHESPLISEEIGNKLCKKWRDILEDISERSGVNLLFSKGFNRTCELSDMQLDNQAMRLGCGAYFSKYASKNSGKYSDDINSINARKYPPSSFWGRSRELARMCDEYSYSFKFEGIDDSDSLSLYELAKEILSQFPVVLSHSFSFKKEMELPKEYGNGTLTICEGITEVFYVSPKDYERLREQMPENFDRFKNSRTLSHRRS